MEGTLEAILLTAAVPAAAALALAWLCRSVLPAGLAMRYALAAATAGAFFCGYWLLPEWAALVPERHWQWLPSLGLAGAAVGGLTSATGVSLVERWLVQVVLVYGAAWLLVPDWDDLVLPRATAVPLLAAYLFVLAAGLAALPQRLRGRLFLGLVAIAALVLAALLAIGISMKYGQLGGILAFALAGGCAGMARLEQPAATIRGAMPTIAILSGGLAFVGTMEPSPPMPALLVVPAAPLALWLFAAGPLSQWQGRRAIVAQTLVVVAIAAAAAIAVLLAGERDAW